MVHPARGPVRKCRILDKGITIKVCLAPDLQMTLTCFRVAVGERVKRNAHPCGPYRGVNCVQPVPWACPTLPRLIAWTSSVNGRSRCLQHEQICRDNRGSNVKDSFTFPTGSTKVPGGKRCPIEMSGGRKQVRSSRLLFSDGNTIRVEWVAVAVRQIATRGAPPPPELHVYLAALMI